jgi:hypothetical protein
VRARPPLDSASKAYIWSSYFLPARKPGPGYIDVSLSLSKKFSLTTKVNAEFRVDAFNALKGVNLSPTWT